MEWLIVEINLCLHVTAKDTSGFSLQHVYTITQRNHYVCEVACIWALKQSADPKLTANVPHCFSLTLRLFVQAVKDNNPQLYLPLAASVAHFMWYPPKMCSSGTMGFAGCCLKHFCRLDYQSKVSLPACYSYMEGVLLDCLTIGSAFSACGGWGRLVNKMALAFVRNQMDNDEYKLVAPLVPLSASKRPCTSLSCCSIPCLPSGSVPSAGTSSGPSGNRAPTSGSERHSPE
ncbi:hypothetical protein DSO57_1005537 [Entomophthora muscae]|uniref:Uncharacterized protein n=1 Tax=Entomophthora muscae TaxID=34485 RepID=A0ACC2TIG2_9FUNG|nr:hypothetical protein DSO57_1005537 [Entomophthora muscae]